MADETTFDDEPPAEKPKYGQAFFLALAARGKDAWNAWRRDTANKDVPVTFAGTDFSEAGDTINFEGFEFRSYADFSNCKWQRAVFKRTVFGDHAKFGNAIFNGPAFFTGATFGIGAQFGSGDFGGGAFFQHTKFGHVANFKGATLGTGVTFERAIFGHDARFSGVSFGHQADFKRTIFRGDVSFDAADFGTKARFEKAIFGGSVNFKGRSKEEWDSVFQLLFVPSNAQHKELLSALKDRHIDLWTNYQSGPDRFLAMSFANARFYGEASFSGRSFEKSADFTSTRFYYPPDFDSVTNAGKIDFTGAHVGFVPPNTWWPHWTEDSQIPVRLRAFRKIAEETKNHDLERDLYIEERKAERGIYWRWPRHAAHFFAHCLWMIVMGLYWLLADCGRNFLPPTAWLVASVFFFDWRYTKVLAPLMAKAPDVEKYKQALDMLALGNAVPFVGPLTIDAKIKEFLFCAGEVADKCTPIPPEGYQLLVVGQNLFSITCVFFIGLALRNYFKIK